MRGLLIAVAALSLLEAPGVIGAHATKKPQIHTLPPLREQEKIVDAWTEERAALIPDILSKYNIDAWLVCPPLFLSNPHLIMWEWRPFPPQYDHHLQETRPLTTTHR
jgi:hypothetical protein